MTAEDRLRQHFMDLRLPPAAVEWLLGVWNAIQVLDDAADGDPIDRDDLHRAIYDLFIDLPSSPFFVHNAGILLPALSLMVLKWKASDDAERAGQADARSFVWRAGYYDVVLAAAAAAHGRNEALAVARGVLSLYGETLDDYLKEFPPCQIP